MLPCLRLSLIWHTEVKVKGDWSIKHCMKADHHTITSFSVKVMWKYKVLQSVNVAWKKSMPFPTSFNTTHHMLKFICFVNLNYHFIILIKMYVRSHANGITFYLRGIGLRWYTNIFVSNWFIQKNILTTSFYMLILVYRIMLHGFVFSKKENNFKNDYMKRNNLCVNDLMLYILYSQYSWK